MDINYAQIYSILSVTEEKNKSFMGNVLDQIAQLDNYKTADSVKAFLKEAYNLNENDRQFYINNDTPVNIRESDKSLSIEIAFKNENIMYCYRK